MQIKILVVLGTSWLVISSISPSESYDLKGLPGAKACQKIQYIFRKWRVIKLARRLRASQNFPAKLISLQRKNKLECPIHQKIKAFVPTSPLNVFEISCFIFKMNANTAYQSIRWIMFCKNASKIYHQRRNKFSISKLG